MNNNFCYIPVSSIPNNNSCSLTPVSCFSQGKNTQQQLQQQNNINTNILTLEQLENIRTKGGPNLTWVWWFTGVILALIIAFIVWDIWRKNNQKQTQVFINPPANNNQPINVVNPQPVPIPVPVSIPVPLSNNQQVNTINVPYVNNNIPNSCAMNQNGNNFMLNGNNQISPQQQHMQQVQQQQNHLQNQQSITNANFYQYSQEDYQNNGTYPRSGVFHIGEELPIFTNDCN